MRTLPQIPLLYSFLFLFLANATLSVGADLEDWTLEEVLAQVVEANGGKEAVKNVTNSRIRGEVHGSTFSYDFLLLKKRPDKMRLRLMFKGRSIETGYDGTRGWRRYTEGDNSRVVELKDDTLAKLKEEVDFDGPLVGPLPEGTSRELLGIERIDRVDYFVVSVKKPDSEDRHYVDSRTFRELKVVQTSLGEDGEPVESVTFYHDYKKYGGIWVANRTERLLPGGKTETVQILEVEVDPGILDMAFKMPES